MTRRRLLLFGVPVAAVALAVGVWALLPPAPGITLENFRRLHAQFDTGMTEKDAVALFGKPGNKEFRVTGSYFTQWNCGEVEIVLRFSEGDGRAIGGVWDGRLESGWFHNRATGFVSDVPVALWEDTEPLLHRFRRWLHL